jgi:hypothetical protein
MYATHIKDRGQDYYSRVARGGHPGLILTVVDVTIVRQEIRLEQLWPTPGRPGQDGAIVQHEQNRREESATREEVGMWLAGLIVGVPLLALLGFAAYCATLGAPTAWSSLGVGCGVAAAATAVGAFLGFLFGIPRTLQGNTAPGPDEIADYRPNTNLVLRSGSFFLSDFG